MRPRRWLLIWTTGRQRLRAARIIVGFALAVPCGGHALAAPADTAPSREPQLSIKPPLPIWPVDFETITTPRPVFRLNGRHEATRYTIELATDAEFTTPIHIERTRVLDRSGIAPVVLGYYEGPPLAEGQYFWRAFCGNDEGFTTPPANYRTFFVCAEDRDAIRVPAQTAHPRLLLTAGELPAFRQRLARSPILQRGWQYQYNAAVSALELDPPDEAYARSGPGQHARYSMSAGWYHRHLMNVAFVALVADDRRLAQKGVEMLMSACAYERWLGPLFDDRQDFDPPWNSALETAMMTEAVAVGYDLLEPHLTPAQRGTVRLALAEKGIRRLVHDWADPIGSSQIPRHQVPTGNWVMVCAASAGIGALAMLGEHPEAAQWTRLVRDRVRAWLHDRGGDYCVDNPWPQNRPTPIPVIGPSEPNFGPDGGYKESISYMNYAMRYVCFFADALREVTGENLFEHVPEDLLDPLAWNVMAWPSNEGVRSWIVDFGDCWGGTSWYGDLLAGLVKHRRDGRAGWLYRRLTPVPTTPRCLLWQDDSIVESPPDASVPMAVFPSIGQVVMRRGWSPTTPMAAIKFHQNRGHLDIGTFYLFGAGRPTIIDSGPADYGSAIYCDYSSQSIAHNLVLVDGRSQARVDGTLRAAVGTSCVTAASGQLAAAYPDALRSWTRDLVMLPEGLAVIFDHLEGAGPRQFDLLLHPEPPFTLQAPGELLIGEPAAAAIVTVHSDGGFTTAEQPGYHLAVPRKYVRFTADSPADRRSFLTVCRWPVGPRSRRADVRVEPVGPGRWRIDHVDHRARLAVRAGGADEPTLSSDARLLAVWDEVTRVPRPHVLLLDATRLSVDRREVFRSSRPISAAVEFAVPLRARFWSEAPARVTLAADGPFHEVYLNAGAIVPTWHAGAMAFDVPAGPCELTAGESHTMCHRMPPLIVDDLAAETPADAPAYRPKTVTRASTSWTDGLDAVDGDPNTAWISLSGAAMPQWLEVQIARPEPMDRVTIGTGTPCAGHLEIWDTSNTTWVPRGRFETTADALSATVAGPPVEASRLRVVIDAIDPASTSASIHSLQWR